MTEEKQKAANIFNKPIVKIVAIAVVIALIIGGVYLYMTRNNVSTDNATVAAPEIDLSPSNAGVLKEVYVKEGDNVTFNETVARVGDELVKSSINGKVISVNDQVGMIFTPGEAVVTVIDPTALRIEAKIDENKGLDKIHAGQPATFTVDAFGGKKFEGTVDSVSSTALQSQVVFSVSDKRETRQFIVKIKYDLNQYPNLLNGMSAKVTIYTGQ
jgi:multidrug resistance efflux pump